MEIIKNEEKKKQIEKTWHEKNLVFKDCKVFNTSWAKDKYGVKDEINLACFVEFVNSNEKLVYWLPKEKDIENLFSSYKQVVAFNTTHNSGAKEFKRGIESQSL